MLSIRPATVQDMPLLRTMIRELADFERELDRVSIREDQLARDGFGDAPWFRALIAESGSQPAGYAVFFPSYSTWAGRTMFLEDVFVREKFRGKGIGSALMSEVARIAVEQECCGLRWEVLDWNQKAIDLYTTMGAEFLDDWRSVLLTDEALRRLAEKAR